jgi:hypothetical protein
MSAFAANGPAVIGWVPAKPKLEHAAKGACTRSHTSGVTFEENGAADLSDDPV